MQSIATERGSAVERPGSGLRRSIWEREAKKTLGPVAAPDAKVVAKLLDLLSTDNEFRRLFKKDPNAALSTLGYNNPKMCGAVKTIASKSEIAAMAMELKAHLVSAGVFTVPHCFEAGKVATSLRRK